MESCCYWWPGRVKKSKAVLNNTLTIVNLHTKVHSLDMRREKQVGERAFMSLGGLNGCHLWSVCWMRPMTLQGSAVYSSNRKLHTSYTTLTAGPIISWYQSSNWKVSKPLSIVVTHPIQNKVYANLWITRTIFLADVAVPQHSMVQIGLKIHLWSQGFMFEIILILLRLYHVTELYFKGNCE